MYMKFDGVDGESTSQGHEKWIDVLSFSWGVSRPATTSGGGGGGGAGKVQVHDISFVRHTGKASPTLMLACCNGKHFPTVKLELTRATPEHEQLFLSYTLEDCIVTSYQVGGDAGSDRPVESLSINFTKITYRQAVPGGFEEAFWDIRSNTGGGGQ
jgi:type VI secretion system secreted protein Hcp